MNEYNINLNNKDIKGKNKKLFLLVGILLLSGGISLAYYVGSNLISGTGSSTSGVTATINGAELHVEGTLNYTDDNFYPGHKMVSAIKVTATGDNELIPYNLIWNGTNGISSLNYTVYKTSEIVNLETTCNKEEKVVNGSQQLSETCTISNIESLGTPLSSGSINKNDTKVILKKDEFINATPAGISIYYYVILEYPNLETDQSTDIGASITGEVTVEKSNAEPDINILAVYVKGDNEEYIEQNEIPEGYQVNTEKSTCSNGAIPSGLTPKITVDELNTTGTSCYLYLDKIFTKDDILANVTIKTETPTFRTISTTDEGVYKASDPLYGSESYYWRGAVTSNYVKFGNFCWRIIRINGDGSIRMIYDGTSCHANGTNTTESIALMGQPYNTITNNSSYVGWTYTTGIQRTLFGTNSNAKTQIESWYTSESGFTDKQKNQIADGKFCNDRNTQNNETWRATGDVQFYAGNKRLWTDYSPTFACNLEDVYTTKVGLITADEMMFAGGKGEENTSYYLYNGQAYWTMTPADWNGSEAVVAVINANGRLDYYRANNTINLRPVINLKANTVFASEGTGTYNNPYVVK